MAQSIVTGPEFDAFENSSVCPEYTHPRNHPAAYTIGSSGVNTKFGSTIEVIVTNKHDMYGEEITIDSTQRDGTKSWVAICRSMYRYVTECALDVVDSVRDDTHTLLARRNLEQ